MMQTLAEEHATAARFLFIATSGQDEVEDGEAVYAWWLSNQRGEPCGSRNSSLSTSVRDSHTAAVLEGALEAVTQGNITAGVTYTSSLGSASSRAC
jgi:hypothetical protein